MAFVFDIINAGVSAVSTAVNTAGAVVNALPVVGDIVGAGVNVISGAAGVAADIIGGATRAAASVVDAVTLDATDFDGAGGNLPLGAGSNNNRQNVLVGSPDFGNPSPTQPDFTIVEREVEQGRTMLFIDTVPLGVDFTARTPGNKIRSYTVVRADSFIDMGKYKAQIASLKGQLKNLQRKVQSSPELKSLQKELENLKQLLYISK
jgi:hypothetical protein